MENPIKMDDLGVPLFLETPIFIHGRFSMQPCDFWGREVLCWIDGLKSSWNFNILLYRGIEDIFIICIICHIRLTTPKYNHS